MTFHFVPLPPFTERTNDTNKKYIKRIFLLLKVLFLMLKVVSMGEMEDMVMEFQMSQVIAMPFSCS